MTFQEFQNFVQQDKLPKGLSVHLLALWHDAKGDWDRAHDLAQSASDINGDKIHAYLHRKEGDQNNANYWYSRVGTKSPNNSLQEEWEELVIYFLTL